MRISTSGIPFSPFCNPLFLYLPRAEDFPIPLRCRQNPSPGGSKPPPQVGNGTQDGIEGGIQMLAEILGKEAQHMAAVFLK